MNDTISRQAAIDAVHKEFDECLVWDESGERTADEVEIILDNVPSVQPEIIRCKECINHGKEICYFWSHFYGTINTPDDGFCHKAERRTDGN